MVEHFYNAFHGLVVLHVGEIYQQYTEYVVRKYKDAIVVFDGYENINTKCMTHQRRSKGKATVTVAANMTITIKEDQFLAIAKCRIGEG